MVDISVYTVYNSDMKTRINSFIQNVIQADDVVTVWSVMALIGVISAVLVMLIWAWPEFFLPVIVFGAIARVIWVGIYRPRGSCCGGKCCDRSHDDLGI